MYLSRDNGENWESIQLNLPVVPVYDMEVRGNNLALATHGRGFWMMDDLTLFRQEVAEPSSDAVRVYEPAPARRWSGNWASGVNAPDGLVLRYRLPEDVEAVSIEVSDSLGQLIRRFDASDDVSIEPGLNTFQWGLRYPNAQRVPGVVTRGNQQVGPKALPGDYTVALIADATRYEVPFEIEADPRIEAGPEALAEHFEFLLAIRNRLDRMNKSVIAIRSIDAQIEALVESGAVPEELQGELVSLQSALRGVEQSFVQVNAEARKDLHANPVALNDKFYRLSNFVSRAQAAPTPTQKRHDGRVLSGQPMRSLQGLR